MSGFPEARRRAHPTPADDSFRWPRQMTAVPPDARIKKAPLLEAGPFVNRLRMNDYKLPRPSGRIRRPVIMVIVRDMQRSEIIYTFPLEASIPSRFFSVKHLFTRKVTILASGGGVRLFSSPPEYRPTYFSRTDRDNRRAYFQLGKAGKRSARDPKRFATAPGFSCFFDRIRSLRHSRQFAPPLFTEWIPAKIQRCPGWQRQ